VNDVIFANSCVTQEPEFERIFVYRLILLQNENYFVIINYRISSGRMCVKPDNRPQAAESGKGI